MEWIIFSSFGRLNKVVREDLYTAYGQTDSGRYLIVFFIRKEGAAALPISARDMTDSEEKYYDRQAESN